MCCKLQSCGYITMDLIMERVRAQHSFPGDRNQSLLWPGLGWAGLDWAGWAGLGWCSAKDRWRGEPRCSLLTPPSPRSSSQTFSSVACVHGCTARAARCVSVPGGARLARSWSLSSGSRSAAAAGPGHRAAQCHHS